MIQNITNLSSASKVFKTFESIDFDQSAINTLEVLISSEVDRNF